MASVQDGNAGYVGEHRVLELNDVAVNVEGAGGQKANRSGGPNEMACVPSQDCNASMRIGPRQ
jgi:hypothetical protein